MPKAPRKPCRKCGKLTEGKYCPEHETQHNNTQKQQRIKYDEKRGTATQRGYNSRWATYSKQYRKEHPLCVECLKKGILTNVENGNGCVDHIIPVSGPDDPLFWDESNHQSLCHTHHSQKTASEDGGWSNSKKDRFI